MLDELLQLPAHLAVGGVELRGDVVGTGRWGVGRGQLAAVRAWEGDARG